MYISRQFKQWPVSEDLLEKHEAQESKKCEGVWIRSTLHVPTNLES